MEQPNQEGPPSPSAVKNWNHIRAITFSCPTKYRPKDGDFEQAALEDDCTVTITFTDLTTQEHTVPKGGGVEKDGDVITVYEVPVYVVPDDGNGNNGH